MYQPNVHIIAGPNGAGKTTFALDFLMKEVQVEQFVNADEIARGLSPLSPERGAVRAGRIFLAEIARLAERRAEFAFETTFSGKTHLRFLRRWKEHGYRVHLCYLWPGAVELSLARVAERVRKGGHSVPEEDVRRRFTRSVRNFFQHYRSLADGCTIFNNQGETPVTIAYEESGHLEVVRPDQYLALVELGSSHE